MFDRDCGCNGLIFSLRSLAKIPSRMVAPTMG